ncbi:uncharacterized protein LOC104584232 [Brachypodium distachyon]|uniref:uncharacterized protein LOC104584232 n=1 Tax=Brachypodium distachyon TaxID=15368 RepID=UPI0001C7440C|nr:uncharacterized protein LOC104584232 [Brachypodium distachyon]|eukprot:XP_010236726.1 uncharacterized protein LOC104584232 [Brachypodium distachyon]
MPEKPWALIPPSLSDLDRCLFAAATSITVRDGRFTDFWHDAWLDGMSPMDLAPDLFLIARRKHRRVRDACWQFKWVHDVAHGINPDNIQQFLFLFSRIEDAPALCEGNDSITWNLTPSGLYSAKSTYTAQFQGLLRKPFSCIVWHVWAPEKCRFFGWLLARGRIPTSDLLQLRGMPNDKWCPFCYATEESATHLLLDCRYARHLWSLVASWLGIALLQPASWPALTSTSCWWTNRIKAARPLGKRRRKGVASIIPLTLWETWKERNRRTFQHKLLLPSAVLLLIKGEAALWNRTGAGLGELVSGDDDVH